MKSVNLRSEYTTSIHMFFFLKSSSNFHENGDELDDESYHNDYSHTKYLANYNLLKLSSFYLGK